jgi:hypothetical protein
VHEAVRQSGRSIPQDISVAGDRPKLDIVDVLLGFNHSTHFPDTISNSYSAAICRTRSRTRIATQLSTSRFASTVCRAIAGNLKSKEAPVNEGVRKKQIGLIVFPGLYL